MLVFFRTVSITIYYSFCWVGNQINVYKGMLDCSCKYNYGLEHFNLVLPVRENSFSVEIWESVIKRTYSSIFNAMLHKHTHSNSLMQVSIFSFLRCVYYCKQALTSGNRRMERYVCIYIYISIFQ